MYRGLHTHVILNNVLKVTVLCIDVHNNKKIYKLLFILQRIPIVENVPHPTERAAARASTMNLYIIFVLQPQKLSMCYWKTELGESFQDDLFYSSSCQRKQRDDDSNPQNFPLPNAAKEVFTSKITKWTLIFSNFTFNKVYFRQ